MFKAIITKNNRTKIINRPISPLNIKNVIKTSCFNLKDVKIKIIMLIKTKIIKIRIKIKNTIITKTLKIIKIWIPTWSIKEKFKIIIIK